MGEIASLIADGVFYLRDASVKCIGAMNVPILFFTCLRKLNGSVDRATCRDSQNALWKNIDIDRELKTNN